MISIVFFLLYYKNQTLKNSLPLRVMNVFTPIWNQLQKHDSQKYHRFAPTLFRCQKRNRHLRLTSVRPSTCQTVFPPLIQSDSSTLVPIERLIHQIKNATSSVTISSELVHRWRPRERAPSATWNVVDLSRKDQNEKKRDATSTRYFRWRS